MRQPRPILTLTVIGGQGYLTTEASKKNRLRAAEGEEPVPRRGLQGYGHQRHAHAAGVRDAHRVGAGG